MKAYKAALQPDAYLYAKGQIPMPYFFISEALEREKHKYYKLLMDIRSSNRWNEWIRFFFETVAKQCRRSINQMILRTENQDH